MSQDEVAMSVVDSYQNLHIDSLNVCSPYFMNGNPRWEDTKTPMAIKRPGAGKYNANELESQTVAMLCEYGLKACQFSPEQMRNFMIANGLGMDCSGFALQIADAIYASLKEGNIFNRLFDVNNEHVGIRRINARKIADNCNSHKIDPMSARSGDMIVCANGSHVICVVSKTDRTLICAHSVDCQRNSGVNVFQILNQGHEDVFNLKWSADVVNGQGMINLGEQMRSRRGPIDGLYRLHALE